MTEQRTLSLYDNCRVNGPQGYQQVCIGSVHFHPRLDVRYACPVKPSDRLPMCVNVLDVHRNNAVIIGGFAVPSACTVYHPN